MRLIDVDALLVGDIYYDNVKCLVPTYEIERAPTVDAVPAVHGEWIKGYVCNQCFKHNCGGLQPYCPNCGAKMEREGK